MRLLTIMVGVLVSGSASAACFCDTGKQAFEIPTEITCLSISPTEGCVKATVSNGCAKSVTLTGWPGEAADVTIDAGKAQAVQVHSFTKAVPTASDLKVVLDGKTHVVKHKAPETCDSGSCTAAARAAPTPWWIVLLIGGLLLGLRRVAGVGATRS